MCVAMTVSFLIAWTPYAVESLVAAHAPYLVGAVTATLPTMLAKSSCMMNPLIYLASSSTFRRDVIKIFKWNKQQRMETQLQPAVQPATRRNEVNSQPSHFFARNTTNPDGKSSIALYYDKNQVYIGNTTPQNIEKERSIVQRELDKISVRFSFQEGIGESSSAKRDSIKSNENRPVGETMMESSHQPKNILPECPSTSDSKKESQPTTSPIFN
ncbi:Rhodopsin, GQ-coupled [Holothuria leucospilota]|uniref:Rhodopsin, GQ-coupled n=1 Tax=Holothuria leucospilota TaxID=206669 RepID=A0A9Q1HA42_HOLLE|nr:Rhodopsin, GQ-coupled [Holothuria leucospilota]